MEQSSEGRNLIQKIVFYGSFGAHPKSKINGNKTERKKEKEDLKPYFLTPNNFKTYNVVSL